MRAQRFPAPVLAIALCNTLLGGIASAQSAGAIDFTRDVAPLLAESCLSCHGATQQLAGLRFDRPGAMRSNIVIPGSSETSRMYLRVVGSDFGPQMPPTGALSEDKIKVIKEWIDQGATRPQDRDAPKLAPPDPAAHSMMEALRKDEHDTFMRALRKRPDAINRPASGGSTPLMFAALYGNAAAVEAQLELGADPNIANHAGSTALMWGLSDLRITRLLLDADADPNATGPGGVQPLDIASARAGAAPVVKLLLDRGAKVANEGTMSPNRRPPLSVAAAAGDEVVFRMLVERGADLKTAGGMALVNAARGGCQACIELLLPTLPVSELNTALVALAPYDQTSLLTRIIERGADVNFVPMAARRDLRRRTPLMVAASSDFLPVDTIRTLLARGADLNAIGPQGETALDLAQRNGRTPVVDLLIAAGAKPGKGYLSSREKPSPSGSVRAAIERILPTLQHSDAQFSRKSGCASCHNNTYTAMTLAAAREHRISMNETVATEQVRAIAAVIESRREMILLGSELAEVAANWLAGLAAANYPADFTTDAAAHLLKVRQHTDGSWRPLSIDHRPPITSGSIAVTAMSLRALRAYAPKPGRAEYMRSVDRGVTWLLHAQARTTDERALQLMGLHWAGIPNGDRRGRKLAQRLLDDQQSDGGWRQLPTLGTDAYATGLTLTALNLSGALGSTDPAYRRGVQYLMNTQLADGSWYVQSRALPFQPYFESGFPHGPDQWISMAATNWAATALINAIER